MAVNRNVIIYARDFRGKFVGMGSGVAIGGRNILTVSHILGNVGIPLDITVIWKEKKAKAKVSKDDGGKDGLAMLFCKEINYTNLRISSVYMGQEILIYGNTPSMFDMPVIAHIMRQVGRDVLQDKNLIYNNWLSADGFIRGGFSGGGVYTNSGLAGIVWGHLTFSDGKSLIMINTPARILEFTREYFTKKN